MKNIHRISAVLIGAASIAAMGGALADARTTVYDEPGDVHVGIDLYGDSGIRIDGDDVVIRAKDGSHARIKVDGSLYIDDKPVAVNDGERKLLIRYRVGIHDIRDRGMQIGRDAVHLASDVIGSVLAGLFSGDIGDKRIDGDEERKAEPLKQEARALCKDVKGEIKLQSELVAELPAFQPYAVIHTDSDHDCRVDNDDVAV